MTATPSATGPLAIPVGVCPTPIGVDARWWLAAARRLEAAGAATAWTWDHFTSRGRVDDPVLECWSLLGAAAATTERIAVGSFVTNVMNRHPAVLARSVATVASIAPGRRVELGIGIGGHPAEHHAYGIDWPDAAERAARLEEAVAIVRALLAGGPVTHEGRFWRLTDAVAFPVPSPAPRITIGGMTRAGARLAARIGDAWTCMEERFDELHPIFLEALAAAGRPRDAVSVLVGLGTEPGDGVAGPATLADLAATAAAWRARGADELILRWVRPDGLDAVLAALERTAGPAGPGKPSAPLPR